MNRLLKSLDQIGPYQSYTLVRPLDPLSQRWEVKSEHGGVYHARPFPIPLPADFTPQRLEREQSRLIKECQRWKEIHLGRPQWVDTFCEGQTLYWIEKPIIGAPLSSISNPLNLAEGLYLTAEVLHLLDEIHAHRDFKSDEPLLHLNLHPSTLWRSQSGRIILMDPLLPTLIELRSKYQLQKVDELDGQQPPEFSRGRWSEASDLYGVGMSILSAMSGLKVKHVDQRLQSDRFFTHDLKVPEEVQTFFQRLTAFRASYRFETTEQAIEALYTLPLELKHIRYQKEESSPPSSSSVETPSTIPSSSPKEPLLFSDDLFPPSLSKTQDLMGDDQIDSAQEIPSVDLQDLSDEILHTSTDSPQNDEEEDLVIVFDFDDDQEGDQNHMLDHTQDQRLDDHQGPILDPIKEIDIPSSLSLPSTSTLSQDEISPWTQYGQKIATDKLEDFKKSHLQKHHQWRQSKTQSRSHLTQGTEVEVEIIDSALNQWSGSLSKNTKRALLFFIGLTCLGALLFFGLSTSSSLNSSSSNSLSQSLTKPHSSQVHSQQRTRRKATSEKSQGSRLSKDNRFEPSRPSLPTYKTDRIQWVSIEEGTFMMGSSKGDKWTLPNETPPHLVRVSSFQISRTPVTVRQYRTCVQKGGCSADHLNQTDWGDPHLCNWNKVTRQDHPINCINWFQALQYARWIGGRLPSEAEWAFVAQNRGQSRLYPWGTEEVSCKYAHVYDAERGSGCGTNKTSEVCQYTRGTSQHGLCDLIGNIWEWVLDEAHSDYEGAPSNGKAWTSLNPLDLSDLSVLERSKRVLRGGGSFEDQDWAVSARRLFERAHVRKHTIGFRVVRDSESSARARRRFHSSTLIPDSSTLTHRPESSSPDRDPSAEAEKSSVEILPPKKPSSDSLDKKPSSISPSSLPQKKPSSSSSPSLGLPSSTPSPSKESLPASSSSLHSKPSSNSNRLSRPLPLGKKPSQGINLQSPSIPPKSSTSLPKESPPPSTPPVRPTRFRRLRPRPPAIGSE